MEKNVESAHKKAKSMIRKLKADLKKASSLFQQTLEVKLQYENIIVSLISDPVTQEVT